MTYNDAFSLLNASVLPGWLLLVFLPRANFTNRFVHSMIYPVVLASFYVTCFVWLITTGEGPSEVDFTKIEGIQAIFEHPVGVMMAWSHYLVFDLFIGAWISRDAIRLEIPHLWTIPCLGLTLMMGPIGLLLYAGVRGIKTRRLELLAEV